MSVLSPRGGTRPQTGSLTELLRYARVGPDGTEAASRRIVGWLGRAVEGTAELVDSGSEDHRPQVRAIARGELGSAVVSAAGCHTRMFTLGSEPPCRALVVSRARPFDA